MRPDERNFERDYERGRERNREREYGERVGMSGQSYDPNYDRGVFNSDRDMNRGYAQDREYNRGYAQDRGYNRGREDRQGREYDRDVDYNRYGQRNQGRYHSTETDNPGRPYQSERDMNRNAHYYGEQGRDRGYREDRDRGYRGREYDDRSRNFPEEPGYRVASRHRNTGPYEDYERDLDRYGLRGENQDRYRGYGEQQERDPREVPNFYYHPGEDEERRRRRDYRMTNRHQERSPSGNWGPSNPRHPMRGREDREQY